MYVNDMKVFAKHEKGMESLILTIRKYTQDKRMEFDINNCIRLKMINGKKNQWNE